jgi:hypothetical protein
MNNFASDMKRRRMGQVLTIVLVIACGSFSMRAAVRLPEDDFALNALLLPAVELLPPANVEGEASGMTTPASEVPEQASAPRVFLRRSLLPGSAKASVDVFALQNRNQTASADAPSLDRDTAELWFGPSQNCRRFAMVCTLMGLPW